MTCMTPRALAEETMELLKPLSCQPMAAARLAGAPCWAAMLETCPPSRRPGVGAGLPSAPTAPGAGRGRPARARARLGDDRRGSRLGRPRRRGGASRQLDEFADVNELIGQHNEWFPIER